MNSYLIALGGNSGTTETMFQHAVQWLSHATDSPATAVLSRTFRTAPVGAAAGNEFLNAAAIVESELPALEFLRMLQDVENRLGRTRAVRWGPRTLDLDLLLADSQVIDSHELLLPHPALWYRTFVLSSAVEIAGAWQHPLFDETLQSLWSRLQQRPLHVSLQLSATLPPDTLSLSLLQQTLHSETSGVTWTQQAADTDFAQVMLWPASPLQPAYSYAVPQHRTRTISLYVQDHADALVQLQQLRTALCG